MIEQENTLLEIEKNVRICRKCRLAEKAHNAVPGEGNPKAKVVFIGEAPGRNEDETGRPFVGRAGQLLEKALIKIGMKREDVWIGNVIKHRPPENRDPLPDEIQACMPYLMLQLKIIKPLLIVTLGRYAMGYFYSDGKISRDRGQLIKVNNFNVFPIYHPAAALRNPSMMKDFVLDFMKIPKVLKDIENPQETFIKENNPNLVDKGQLGLDI